MKNLLLLLVLLPFVSLSQIKIDSNLIMPAPSNTTSVIEFRPYFLKKLKSNSNTIDVDSLYSLKSTYVRNPIDYINAITTSTILGFNDRRNNNFSCVLDSAKTDNGILTLYFYLRNNNNIRFTLIVQKTEDGGFSSIIYKYKKDRKIKTYFTDECILVKRR